MQIIVSIGLLCFVALFYRHWTISIIHHLITFQMVNWFSAIFSNARRVNQYKYLILEWKQCSIRLTLQFEILMFRSTILRQILIIHE